MPELRWGTHGAADVLARHSIQGQRVVHHRLRQEGAAPSDTGSKTEKTDTAEKGDKAAKTDTKTDTAAAAKSEPSPAPAASKPSSES